MRQDLHRGRYLVGATGSDGPSGTAPHLGCKVSLLKVNTNLAFIPLFHPWWPPEELRSLWRHPNLCPHRILAPEQVLEVCLWISADDSQIVPFSFLSAPCPLRAAGIHHCAWEQNKRHFPQVQRLTHRQMYVGRRCSLLRLRERSLFLQVTHPRTAHTFGALPTVQQAHVQ